MCAGLYGHPVYSIQRIQGKSKLLKNPECKKYSILNTVKNFRTNSVFQGKRKVAKNLEW